MTQEPQKRGKLSCAEITESDNGEDQDQSEGAAADDGKVEEAEKGETQRMGY